MGMETAYLRTLAYGLKNHMGSAEEVEKIIINHSLASAASAVASGWIPGLGGAFASGMALGFVISMYYRICNECKIKLSKNILKALASVVVAEIAATLSVVLAAEIALTFIPVVGNFSASVVAGIVNFGIVYVAGALFLKMMVNVFKANVDINNLSEEELKNIMKSVTTKENIKDAYNESKNIYKDAKNDKKYSTDNIRPDEG